MTRWLLFGFCFAVTAAMAQSVADITLNDVRTDKPVSLLQFSGYKAVVVVFTSNACPFDTRYRSRLFQLVRQYEGRVPFLFINSFSDPEEAPARMKALHAEINFPAPYLEDKQQLALNMFNARKSPECLVLKPEGKTFTVFYRGAIDDNPQMAEAVNRYWLKEAIEALLNGQLPNEKENRPVGCAVQE